MMKTLLVQALLLAGLTNANDSPSEKNTQSPFRFRLNTNALTNIIHLRDQEVFKVFEDVVIDEDLQLVSKIKFSLAPTGVELEDFDLDIHLSKDYLGAETDKVTVSGTVTLTVIEGSGETEVAKETEVAFTAPVPLVKLQYQLGENFDKTYNVDRFDYKQTEWVFKTGDVVGEGLTPEQSAEIASAIDKNINDFKQKFEKGSKDGKMENVKNFPMDTVIPMAAIYYATQYAAEVEYQENFVMFGYSLQKFDMLTEKQTKLLKVINHEFFNEKNKDDHEALLQFTIDDNLFNSVASVFTSADKTFSMRQLMKQNPKTRPFVQSMNTMILATVFPSFAEKYGNDAPIDIMLSPSHSLFKSGFPNSKMSGIYIDKNGNWKVQVNVPMTILVEKPGKQWEEAREVYITMVFKFKITSADVSPNSKKFSVTPKNLEVTNLKVINDGNEEEMEQMMIQSMLNIQLENLKREFKEFPFHMRDILKKNPKELQCLGFNIADLDIAFRKSQVQMSAYFKKTKYQNKQLCDDFLNELRANPEQWFNQFKENDVFKKSMQDAQKLAAGDKTVNPFEDMINQMGKGVPNFNKDAKKEKPKQTIDKDEEDAPDHEEL